MAMPAERASAAAASQGWLGRFGMYALTVGVCLFGPVLIGFSFVASSRSDFVACLAFGIVVMLILAPLCVAMSMSIAQDHRESVRLGEVGVPASAEILAIRKTTYGEEDRLVMTLRISGPGITPFEPDYRCAADPNLHVGDRHAAIVDPATNQFAIPNRR